MSSHLYGIWRQNAILHLVKGTSRVLDAVAEFLETAWLVQKGQLPSAQQLKQCRAHGPHINLVVDLDVLWVRRILFPGYLQVRQNGGTPCFWRAVPRIATRDALRDMVGAAEIVDDHVGYHVRIALVETLHHENVVRLQVVVRDVLCVQVGHTGHGLFEDCRNPLLAQLRPIFHHRLHVLVQIATWSKFRYDEQLLRAVGRRPLHELDDLCNVRMFQGPHLLEFLEKLLAALVCLREGLLRNHLLIRIKL
mmetsp:Transcript_43942/g.116158  ORF Transcript_43942/g.116158 Transcript_43942/m.116158 type:complete len:250 (-) Transcript_43942:208-957(-)